MKWMIVVVAALVAAPALADKKDRFSKADVNNDGFLSKEEFYTSIDASTSQKYFFVYEENGLIDRSDFEKIQRRIRQNSYREGT